MQPTPVTYPIRLFVRHKAHQQVSEALQKLTPARTIDPVLLQDVTNTVLQPQANPSIYQSYGSRAEAEEIEEQAADAIANAYLRIIQRQQSDDVQQLNLLLLQS
jgi:hypothetical protein